MVQAIPEYAHPCEYGYYLALNLEESYNQMMQNIGIHELHSLEEHGVVMLEDGEASSAEAKKKENAVLKFLHEAWEKVKGVFESALKVIKDLIDKAKTKISALIGSEKNKGKVVDRISKLKTSTKDGKDKVFGKTYDWKDDACTSLFDIAGLFTKDMVYDAKGFDDIKKDVESKIGAKANDKGKDIKKAVDKMMRGDKEIDVTISYIKSNIDSIWDWATNFNVANKGLGKALKEAKKNFDAATNTFKKSVARKDRDDAFKNTTKALKEMSTMLAHISSAVCINTRIRTADSIKIVLRLCVAAKNKEKAEKAVGESYIPNSFQTELASLFNF